jgi:hypothetical protein
MLKSSLLGLAAALAATAPACAYGALAIGGNTAEIAAKGVAVGYSHDYGSEAEADDLAVKECLAYTGAPAETVAKCKLVQSFSHAWLVIALDPAPSTPGFGWSIDADKAAAERNAMDQCKASSPDDRMAYCEIGGEASDSTP